MSEPTGSGYARDATYSAIARMAPLAVQLIATPFVIASAGVGSYAVWALLITTINLIMTADLGVVGIMQRYHGLARGRDDMAMGGRVTATVFSVLIVALVIVTALGPYIADAVLSVIQVAPDVRGQAWEVFRHAGTLAVLQLIGLGFSAYLAAHSRFATAAFISIVARLLSAIAITVALVSGTGLTGLLNAAYIDAAAAVVLGIAFCWRHLLTEVRGWVKLSELKELWSYSWRNQASAIGFVAQRESDVLMAAIMLPAAMQATIASTASLAAAVSLAPTVLLVPLFTRLSMLAGVSRRSAVDAAHPAETAWFTFALPFAAVVLAMGPFLAAAWLGPELNDVEGVTALLVLGFVIVLANSVRAILVRAIGRPGLETLSYVVLLIVKLAVGIPATLLFGLYGLAASTVVASLAAVIAMALFTRRSIDGLKPGRVVPRSVIAAVTVIIVGVAAGVTVSLLVADRWIQLPVLIAVAAVLAVGALLITSGPAALRRGTGSD